MTRNLFSLNLLVLFFTSCGCKQIFVVNSYAPAEDDLVSVVVLFRHGDRTPISSYPNDPYYDISYWPDGYGQLLNKGKQRHYELGAWFRERYTGFLPEEYSPKYIRVISTDVDRTLMSAASNLAGLYPPPASQIWDEDLRWEPIPIHTTSVDNDEILAMERKCPKRDELYEEVISSDFFKNISIEYKDLFDYVSNHTGWNDITVPRIAELYSVFYVYQNYNASYIPAWADNLDQDKFTYLAGLDFARITFTDELKRLMVGPFFNYLTKYFDNVVKNATNTPRFIMLSAHDSTVASLLNAMGAYDYWPPEFASTVLWELRRTSNGTHYINLLYKRNSSNILEELTVNGCAFNCVYENFKSNLESTTVNTTTWDEECRRSHSKLIRSQWYSILFVIMLSQLIKIVN